MNRYLTAFFIVFLGVVFVLADDTRAPRHQPAIPSEVNLAANGNTAPVSDTLIQYLVNQTNLDSLTRYVNILSGEDSATINGSTYLIVSRYASHPHNDLAADFIFQTLNNFGLPTYSQQYDSSGRNVYSVQAGTIYPEKMFIICAHYDDKPIQPPAPGADDNAGGVAAVLEAARILSRILAPYTTIYALWDEEEIGKFGSEYYAQQAKLAGDDILGVVNLDLLGWDGNNDGLVEIHTRPIASSVHLADLIYSLENYFDLGLSPVFYNPGTSSSDNANFWYRGYTAVVLTHAYDSAYPSGEDWYPFYHSHDDRIANFNLPYFHALSKLAVATIAHLAFYNIVSIPLPVELSSFSAQVHDNSAILEWSTETENNNYGFEVQRSSNGILFTKIGFVSGNTTSSGQKHYEFVDQGLTTGTYYYRLEQIDLSGDYEFSRTIKITIGAPDEFRLEQNTPNPLKLSTAISYSLPESGEVELTIYNVYGQIVYKLVDEFQEAGQYTVKWSGIDVTGKKVASGIYFYKIQAVNSTIIRKMILAK